MKNSKQINGVTFKKFQAPGQPKPLWNAIIGGRVRASYETVKEAREATSPKLRPA